MNLKNKNNVAIAILLLVIFAGGFLAKSLIEGKTANRTLTLSDRNGTLQGLVHTGPPVGHPLVPFLGPFAHNKKGVTQCGPAVQLMEGALKRKKFRHTPPRNCVGVATVGQIKAFQRSIHYKPTGVYNKVTHDAIVKRGGYTQEARRGLVVLARKELNARKRHNVLVIAGHARLVGGSTLAYCQSSTRSYFPAWPRVPPCTDCSGFVTWIAYQAGFGAAVGYVGPGSPVGWTGTLTYQGVLVRPNQPLAVGDMVFYPSRSAGGRPWGHVAMAIGHGLVISHGSVGVKILPYNYRPVGEIRRYLT